MHEAEPNTSFERLHSSSRSVNVIQRSLNAGRIFGYGATWQLWHKIGDIDSWFCTHHAWTQATEPASIVFFSLHWSQWHRQATFSGRSLSPSCDKHMWETIKLSDVLKIILLNEASDMYRTERKYNKYSRKIENCTLLQSSSAWIGVSASCSPWPA